MNGEGADFMVGGGGSAVLDCGDGNDVMRGDDAGTTVAAAHHGRDTLSGGAGDEALKVMATIYNISRSRKTGSGETSNTACYASPQGLKEAA